MKTLGILGGMSPESTVSYYLNINRAVNQVLGGNSSARLLIFSVNFEEIAQCQKQGDWQRSGEILAEQACLLEQAGADGILLATNTMHKVAKQISDNISVPFLHILDCTAEAIKAKGINKVALLGTQFTMSDNFYRDGLIERGITPIVPDETTQKEIHRIIFDELCLGKIEASSKTFYLETIKRLSEQGAEGVILGCTEIGLLITQADSSLPFFDTAALHSQMAVDFVLGR
ncbi:aspartate/glutamate racemase family protein [Mannheimia varigena]|uniref:aspartate/glutamate racemase family protein n=1 Tax=Mannheimia varigena TaxID=85404 RepID=UPI0003E329C0|nr:aspartate/glutamate racemase family protein [Mannheimia varigena]AHG78300.1 RacX protein [Mannheimia varigena USDA-ARS-USMARC-1312]AHG78956.1 RacX protein [Mannheimia varigena USDA-ARS-USMARC-1388]AWW33437.1 aspartate/glutamate racemase family protein [Mannheimia varigena]